MDSIVDLELSIQANKNRLVEIQTSLLDIKLLEHEQFVERKFAVQFLHDVYGKNKHLVGFGNKSSSLIQLKCSFINYCLRIVAKKNRPVDKSATSVFKIDEILSSLKHGIVDNNNDIVIICSGTNKITSVSLLLIYSHFYYYKTKETSC